MENTMIEKHIKDGKVAVLYSPGYGAGWSTWNSEHASDFAFNADLVSAFLEGGSMALAIAAEKKFPDCYTGGARDVQIEWVPQGTAFRINEYDGNESIEYIGAQSYLVA
jgi:hypothetical protein